MLRLVFTLAMFGLLAGCAEMGLRSERAAAPEAEIATGTAAGPVRVPGPVLNGNLPRRSAMAFVGQSRRDLVSWLGQPDLELSEGQGSLLQFRQGQCVALAMVGAGDAVAAIEVSGVDSRADRDCAGRQLSRAKLQ